MPFPKPLDILRRHAAVALSVVEELVRNVRRLEGHFDHIVHLVVHLAIFAHESWELVGWYSAEVGFQGHQLTDGFC